MSKKFIAIILMISLLTVLAGCGEKTDRGKSAKGTDPAKSQVAKKKKVEPQPDQINEEQQKHPLPDSVKPYTGVIKKVAGSKITVDIQGVDYDIKVTDKTNLQKGAEAGKGKLAELKPQMKINVLVQGGVALAVHYE